MLSESYLDLRPFAWAILGQIASEVIQPLHFRWRGGGVMSQTLRGDLPSILALIALGDRAGHLATQRSDVHNWKGIERVRRIRREEGREW